MFCVIFKLLTTINIVLAHRHIFGEFHGLVRSIKHENIVEYEKFGSITAALKAQGVHDYVRAQTRITARPPSAEDCELLDMPRHVPLIVTQAVNHDTDGIVLEYGEARMASDRVELMITPDEISH
jgi:DNA-binding GntR family transcriptional regulator